MSIFINHRLIKKIEFPNDTIIDGENKNPDNGKNNLKEDLVGLIGANQFDGLVPDSNGDFIVTVQYFHKDLWWKGGWFLDGGRLEKIDKDIYEKDIKMFE